MLRVKIHIAGSRIMEWIDPSLWAARGYPVPSPANVKRSVLRRHGQDADVWVETGTYLGRTTKFLSRYAKQVITIEPDALLAQLAKDKFQAHPNVHVIHGFSEEVLPRVISQLSGSISFWLDGHFSGGLTARGRRDSPIQEELTLIEQHINQFSKANVFVDDFREFGETEESTSGYPSRFFLVSWAERNNLVWSVEHDIFIAKKKVR